MTRRLLLTCSAAAWLTGMYLLYAHLVSPFVEPAQLTAQESDAAILPSETTDSQPGEQDVLAREYLPDQDWAKNADKQLRVGDMFVYFNELEQTAGKAQLRFSPFALVWKNPKGKPGEAPLRITAEAAVIEFESSQPGSNAADLFDITSARPGRPKSGTLEGEVHIEGPNGLNIRGHGFNFSEESLRLWCDSEILFHYGPHHGKGRGLQVDFLASDEKSIKPDMPRLGGLRSVSLLQQVEVNLLGEATPGDGQRKALLPAGDRLQVVSDGRMQLDLEANLLTFDQNVRVRHPQPNNQQEGLNCDLLTLVLSQPAAGQMPNSDSPAPNGGIALASNEEPELRGMESWLPEELRLDKLLADGSGKKRVEIFSQVRNIHCNAAQVEYDLARHTVGLRDPASVDVLQGPHQLHAPDVTLTLHENQRDIREAVARGSGTASSRLNDGRTIVAKWGRQLVKSTDPGTQRDVVELQGAASIALGLEYELGGDALHLEFSSLAMSTEQKNTAPRSGRAKSPPPRIERLAGVGQVVLKSPQATAHTQRLNVNFQTEDLPPAESGQQDSLFGLQSGNETGRQGARGKAGARREPAMLPMDVTADSVQAVVKRDRVDTTRMVLANLQADDAVTITQPLKPGEPPVQMLGKQLHVQNVSPTQQLVRLTGSPAQIRSGVSRLEGSDIRLNRQQNTLVVLSPGVLQYPVNVSLDGQPLDRPQVLQVKWAEKLEFNGTTADFYEKVEASLQQTVMRCSAMHVTLLTPIRFDDPQLRKLAASRLQLGKISCENKVELESAEYQGNLIISRSFGRLGHFVVDNLTGKTEAMGPGYFMEWRRGQRQGDTRLTANKVAKPIAQTAKAQEWTYSRIDFQGLMKGNVRERFTTFEDHVEIVYGPVQHATDHIEPDELPEGAASITCDALKVEQCAETNTTPAYVKLSAEGNTMLELELGNQPLHAQADEVKFDESKDYYLLRSIGNQKVIINRQPTTEDPRGRIKCSRVDIFRSRREFKVHQATELNGVQQ